MPFLKFALAAVASSLAATPSLAASTTLVASGFAAPVFLTAPQGDSRLFVVEQGGIIKVRTGSTVSNFLNISTLVESSGEQGLLGLAFDPNYASNGVFYVNYIDKVSKDTVIAAFRAPNPASGAADPSSRRLIMTIDQPAGRNNHKAGWIGFSATDPGQLYIATGDGGSGNDPDGFAQNLNSNLGKMLRITPNPNGGYSVPASNPFVSAPGNDEIWAYGLRNPYRNSFDRATGDLYIADVGQSTREELNFALNGSLGGANYGWRSREGRVDNPGVGDADIAGRTDPIFDYGRATGGSIIGGYVLRGTERSELNGLYLFGDFVSNRLFTLNSSNPDASFTDRSSLFGVPLSNSNRLLSFGEDSSGGVYALTSNGSVYLLAAPVPEPGAWALMLLGLAALPRRKR
jgi:glucose/arabinose dehydrogenase